MREDCARGRIFAGMLIHNVIYRSNEQFHVRFIDGERKEEPYYLYYMFRSNGVWIAKTTDKKALDLDDFMEGIDLAEILHDPHHTEPMDENRELLYQCGTYELRDETAFLSWKNSHLEEKERGWYFRIRNPHTLSTDFEEIIMVAVQD